MLTMKAAVIVLLMCIKAVYTAPCTTNPVAEGSTAVIRQTVPKTKVTNGNIKWRFINAGGTDMTVTECTIYDNPPCTSTLFGDNVYSSTMMTSDSDYQVTLTIHNVNRARDQTTWKWTSGFGDDGVIGQCDLDVYYQVPTYTCRGYSGLGSGPTITYKPKFAYGPSAITIAFQPQSDTKNKCEPDASFTTYCDIAVANANPEPTTTVTVSDVSTVTELSGSETAGHYRYKFKVAPEKGGTLTVTCSSFNPAFPDLKTDMSKTIGVQEPPQSSPVMTVGVRQQPVANNGVVAVTDGDDVKVTCRVDGGYPLVNEVTTTCAGVKNVNGGIQAIQTIYVKKGDNNQKCICEAKHVTGCYHKRSEFTLDVQYTPTVTKYQANSKSTELTVSADDTVTFVCNAEGNPRPSVSVRGQMWDGVVTLQDTPSGSYGKESSGTKTMSCKDTDVYTCMADNGVSGGMSKDVSVFVECVPELPLTPFIQEFSTSNGTDLEIAIPIISFPEPKNYLLKKVSDNNRRKRAVTDDIGEDRYKVTYIPDNPPKGVVVLTMMGLTEKDSGQYVLTIDNGIKDGLDYTFNVSVITEKKDPSDDNDDDNNIVIGLLIGLLVVVVLTASVCLVLVKVRMNRWAKERQSLQQQVQQQQHQIQEQQRQQSQQPQRHPTHYEEIGLNEYDGLNILDTQTQANGYQHIGPHDARERQTPITGTREDGSTEQRGGPITRQDSSYENEGFQTDHNHGSDVGPGSNYQNITRPDTSYANQDIGTDILEGGVERPGNYVNVRGFKESVAMTTDTNVAIDDTHVYLEPKDVVTETNESHSEYEISDVCP